ncbi:sensor histidine kinase [Archangium gephyra]|nr:sensor histidine kinase [Archangium gephyra]
MSLAMALPAPEKSRSRRRHRTALLLLVFLVPVALAAWWTLRRIELRYQQNLQDALTAVVAVSHEGLQLWAEDKKADVASWAQSEHLSQAVVAQLEVPRTAESLTSSPPAMRIRQLLLPVVQLHNYSGYLVLAPDGTAIASDPELDAAIGLKTMLMLDPALVEGALSGEPRIGSPHRSRILLPTVTGSRREQPIQFVAAPIRGSEGPVVAVLVFRLAPERDFTRVVQLGRFGRTGETYAFNQRAQMITSSRFEDQLQAVGLLRPSETSLLNVELRDPGTDLTEGGMPTRPRPHQPLTLMADSALTDGTGSNITGYRDYRGVRVVGAWIWDDSLGVGLATEIDIADGFQSLRHTQVLVLGLLGVVVVGALVLAWFLDRRAQALHGALTLRDDFLTLASHELKTPLTVLQLTTQRMAAAFTRSGHKLSPEKQEALAATLLHHVQRLNKLLEAMFDVAQFRDEGLLLQLEPVVLSEVLQSALRQFRTEIAEHGAAISVAAPDDVIGLWDRTRIEQVVVCLLSNALKFGKGKPVEVALERGVSNIRLSIQDHGIGIKPEDQVLIFERFGHAASSRHFGGLGLSLFRVRRIIEAHGGQLRVESAPGAGAKFIVELPIRPRRAGGAAPAGASTQAAR